jgi:hypothetical protein
MRTTLIFGSEQPGCSSARALQPVRYGSLDPEGRRVSLAFELGDNLSGELRACFHQASGLADLPVFELRALIAMLERLGRSSQFQFG